MLGVATHPHQKKTAVLDTLSCPDGRLQSAWDVDLAVPGPGGLAAQPPDPVQVAEVITRCQAYEALREFRARLYGCLASRPDALSELADAVLCADHAVTSLVQLSLEPEFRRGHGALYDCLSAGRVDDERLFSLLAEVLPPLVDGAEAPRVDHGA
jgi:hypothetical protein